MDKVIMINNLVWIIEIFLLGPIIVIRNSNSTESIKMKDIFILILSCIFLNIILFIFSVIIFFVFR